jgi:hypothetical protein
MGVSLTRDSVRRHSCNLWGNPTVKGISSRETEGRVVKGAALMSNCERVETRGNPDGWQGPRPAPRIAGLFNRLGVDVHDQTTLGPPGEDLANDVGHVGEPDQLGRLRELAQVEVLG